MIYLLLSTIFFTGVILVSAAAARNANTNMVALITEAVSALPPLLVILFKTAKQPLSGQKFGLWMAALSGMLVGLYVLTFNKALTQNKVGVVVPIIYGGGLFFSALLSYFIYNERLSILEGAGLALILIGLLVIIYARVVLAH